MELLIGLFATLQINHTPSHWYISCERWQKRSKEIMVDESIPLSNRLDIVYYLRTKVKGECDILS